jgi:transmembrane sensor
LKEAGSSCERDDPDRDAGRSPGSRRDPALTEALAALAASERLSDGDIHRMRGNRRRAAISATAGMLVIAIGGGLWSSGSFAPSPVLVAQIETARGEQRSVRLADGSVVRLNGGTRLDVRLARDSRTVQLARGEAFFDVAHQPARPFTVVADATSTRVLGTAFDVAMNAGGVRLAVYRGRVRFGGEHAAGVVVPAGWRSRYFGGVVIAPERFDAGLGDWRQGWLDTDHMRLDELVAALNRRGGPAIDAPPASLAGLQLAGRFRLDRSRELLDAIGASYGFAVHGGPDRLRLVAIH